MTASSAILRLRSTASIDANRVFYAHDDSDVKDDDFVLALLIWRHNNDDDDDDDDGSEDASPSDVMAHTRLPTLVNVTVEPVNDEPFRLVTQNPRVS